MKLPWNQRRNRGSGCCVSTASSSRSLPIFDVIYCYSPCPERFQMDMRLSGDSTMLASMSKHFGCLPVNIEPFWLSIAPFALPSRSDPRAKDPWHHCDPTGKWALIHFWDILIKKLMYLALADCGSPLDKLDQYEMIPPPPPLPIIPVVVAQLAEALSRLLLLCR